MSNKAIEKVSDLMLKELKDISAQTQVKSDATTTSSFDPFKHYLQQHSVLAPATQVGRGSTGFPKLRLRRNKQWLIVR